MNWRKYEQRKKQIQAQNSKEYEQAIIELLKKIEGDKDAAMETNT